MRRDFAAAKQKQHALSPGRNNLTKRRLLSHFGSLVFRENA